ncbi:MAG: hypothetical protein OXE80_10535 [Gammaproteobacteria bacterium]|nr:hypothetical protein [Gammaproteobacteria bacterium]MCY4297224.1 hypothetical protein [Gammaproteobacteria bacterium]
MAKSSIMLFFRGKLFQNPALVYRQLAIGILIASACLLALAAAGLPLWFCAIAGGFLGGLVQPWLFKDLKYQ